LTKRYFVRAHVEWL